MMAFETVNEATRIWIKGREFSVARLLGPEYKSVIHKFEGGALGIFRWVVRERGGSPHADVSLLL